ncbi:MAG: exodeoxyribonuclease VII small subunit [Gammaproteobacteria bacterium]
MVKKRKDPPDFEKALEELEGLVEKMEAGELSLEDSLRHFERGIELTRTCQKALKTAEQKVLILVEKDGNQELASFESDES